MLVQEKNQDSIETRMKTSKKGRADISNYRVSGQFKNYGRSGRVLLRIFFDSLMIYCVETNGHALIVVKACC